MKIVNYIKSLNINILSCLVLVIYPILLLCLLIHYVFNFDLKILHLIIFLLGYYIANISVGVGVHRLWAHASFKAHPIVEFLLAMFFSGTMQGPILSWVSNHIDHHSFTDTDKDPHTPLRYKSKIMGFLWSHIGWMLVGEGSFKSINRITIKKLGKNKILRFQLKYYWQCVLFMNLIFPFLLGVLLFQSAFMGYSFFLFVGLGRALQQEMTFCVNSICHFFGSQKYSAGTSRDIWWMAPFLLGENWHNFHHAFPNDYRNGSKWYHLDIHKWIIYSLKLVGLAWDLKITQKERINSRVSQLVKNKEQEKHKAYYKLQEKLNTLLAKVNEVITADYNLITKKQNIQNIFENFKEKIFVLKKDLQNYSFKDSSSKILDSVTKKVNELEISFSQICNKEVVTFNNV
ncbi:MAG: fatty acid desaturase [Rickettsia sp.]|nr:fatty acid desaturase [Rickettsia sp.]